MRDNEHLRQAIKSGLTQTINEHGPITKRLIGSAIKRIIGAFNPNPNSKTKDSKKIPSSTKKMWESQKN